MGSCCLLCAQLALRLPRLLGAGRQVQVTTVLPGRHWGLAPEASPQELWGAWQAEVWMKRRQTCCSGASSRVRASLASRPPRTM